MQPQPWLRSSSLRAVSLGAVTDNNLREPTVQPTSTWSGRHLHRTPTTTAFFASPAPFSRCGAKKGPQNPISVVDGKPGGVRERPMTDPSASITRRAQPGVPAPGRPAGACATVARTVAVRATVPPSRHPPGGRPSCGATPSRPGACRPVSTRGSETGVKPAPAPGGADLTGRAEWRLDACGPGRQASPPHRPGIRAGRHHPRQRRGRARGHRPGPPRARPCRASPPAGPGRVPHSPAEQRARGAFPLSPGPRAGRPGPRPAVVGPAGGGLDRPGGAERPSSRPQGRAAPGNPDRSRPAPRHPGRRTRDPRATRC